MQVPELTDDAVVELAREGGVAFIPKLSGQRTIALSSLNEAQRQRLVSILEQAFPRGQPPGQASSPGSGDQRYFRIQIIWTGQNQAHYADIIVLVPEQEARRVAGRAVEERRRLRLRLTFGPNKLHAFFRDKTVAVLAEIVHRAAGF
jgi:hypothetical protein